MKFKDFAPHVLERHLIGPVVFETFAEAVEAATRWVVDHKIDVINVETVVLPNLYREEGNTTTEPDLVVEAGSDWYQFVRVWYRDPASAPGP